MEFCLKAPDSGALMPEISPEEYANAPAGSDLGNTSVNDLFPHLTTEDEVSLEWLSIFVEDCLSSSGNCFPVLPCNQTLTKVEEPIKSMDESHGNPSSLGSKLFFPVKPRSKRRRPTAPKTHQNPLITWPNQTLQFTCSDPPLLQQSQWLADSELIILPRGEEEHKKSKKVEMGKEITISSGGGSMQGQQVRRCSHCQTQKTPQWRAGPLGPKTLCNACGVRFKSGRLFPEYRPAKSPTFMSCMHSNSHKKVLQMRTALLTPPNQHSSF